MKKINSKKLSKFLLFFKILAVFSLFSSCLTPNENSKSFDISSLLEGGLGGTGIDGGLGGTGIDGGLGGTGIEGTITAFGSIVVNGIHIQYDPQKTYSSIFGIRKNGDLQVGQVVSVLTEIEGDNFTAVNIAERTAIAGKVSDVNLAQNYIFIAGTRIDLGQEIVKPADISIGSQVAISGFWNQGKVVASLIDSVPDNFDLGNDTIYGFETQNALNAPATVTLSSINGKLPSKSYVFVKQNSEQTRTTIEKVVPDIASIAGTTLRETIEIVDGNKAQRKIVFNTPTTKQEILIDSVNWKKIGLSTSKNFKEKIRELKDSAPQIKEQKKRPVTLIPGSAGKTIASNSGGGNSGGGNRRFGNSGGGNSEGQFRRRQFGGGNSGGGNSGGGNSGGGNSGGGNSGGGNSGGGNSGGGKGNR